MIYRKKKLVSIGTLVKTHGVHGAMILRLIQGYNPSIINKVDYCFLSINSKPVPYKIAEATESNQAEIILGFENINSKPEAEELLNLDIAIERNSPIRKKKTDNILLLLGYKVFDDGIQVGTVLNIENSGKQFLFVLENEILLPIHEDLIESIDDKSKSIFMNLPEGLI